MVTLALHLNFGFVIQDGHIYLIPHIPDPPLHQLKAASSLWRAAQQNGDGLRNDESELAEKLASAASKSFLAGGVIVTDGRDERRLEVTDKSLAFFDEDGGGFCGTTGRPIPFPPRLELVQTR